MKQQNWTWEKIHQQKDSMSDAELEAAIGSMMPQDIEKITDKIDQGLDLTASEERRLSQWESSPQSGVAGGIMGGMIKSG